MKGRTVFAFVLMLSVLSSHARAAEETENLGGTEQNSLAQMFNVQTLDRPKNKAETKAVSRKEISLDFESFNHEYSPTLPWAIGEITISGVGGNYLPLVHDLTRYTVVQGPRSMAMALNEFGSYMKLTFKNPVYGLWLSFIKGSKANPDIVSYTTKDKNGNVLENEKIDLSNQTYGVYRTFFLPQKGAKSIEFPRGNAALVRVMASY